MEMTPWFFFLGVSIRQELETDGGWWRQGAPVGAWGCRFSLRLAFGERVLLAQDQILLRQIEKTP